MQAKNVLYAAVGAPVVAVRKVNDRVTNLKGRVTKETDTYTKMANETIDEWASEGEKLVAGIRDGKMVEEISQKVDLDQAKEQVSKLRDQLEDMLDTWRQSFRPEQAATPATPAPKTAAATKPAAKSSATKASTTKKPAAKKPAAKKPAAKSSAAKTTKSSSAAKKSPAKSTASKASSAS
jgi:hypothetical protein